MKSHVATVTLVLLASAAVSPAQDVARLDALVQSYVTDKRFMGTVLVARGDQVVLSKGYGAANLEWNIPNTPATKFRLGSVTKQFTAASILLLEERGALAVTDPVKKYVADAPPAWDGITIFNLLTHSSGIPNFTAMPEYASLRPLATSVDKVVAKFRDQPLDFPPGEKMSYSNSGYLLLGLIIEKVTGQTYEEFVRKNIFAPLKMSDSGYDSNTAIIERRADGYAPDPSGPQHAGFIHMSIPHAAGALYSTTEDLLRWQRALFGGKVLSASSLKKMTTPFKDDYAFGLVVRKTNGRIVFTHGGGIEGFNTSLAYYPEEQLSIAVLANLNGPAAGQLNPALAAAALGEPTQSPSERKEITVSPDILAKYVGTYEVRPGVTMTITREGIQLMTQISGQQKFPVFALSETLFFLKAVDAQVEFVKDDRGAVTHALMKQNGNERTVKKISDTVAERVAIAVPAATLTAYVGTYEVKPGFDLAITLEGDRLAAQATGQGRFPLLAESPASFFAKDIDIQIEFGKDDKGAVTHLTLHQGPMTTKAARK